MPDMEQYIFPNFWGLCGLCEYADIEIRNKGCILNNLEGKEETFLEELSVFYVGVTRAKEQLFFSSSQKRFNSKGEIKNAYISCLLSLPGIEYSI